MNKQDFIIEIMNLYDENERLKNEIEIMKHYRNASNSKVENENVNSNENTEDNFSYIDKIMIEFGKEKVLNRILYSWRKVEAIYNCDIGLYTTTSYDNWFREKLNKGYIPDELSVKQLKYYFSKELHEMYEKEKEEALKEATRIDKAEDE